MQAVEATLSMFSMSYEFFVAMIFGHIMKYEVMVDNVVISSCIFISFLGYYLVGNLQMDF